MESAKSRCSGPFLPGLLLGKAAAALPALLSGPWLQVRIQSHWTPAPATPVTCFVPLMGLLHSPTGLWLDSSGVWNREKKAPERINISGPRSPCISCSSIPQWLGTRPCSGHLSMVLSVLHPAWEGEFLQTLQQGALLPGNLRPMYLSKQESGGPDTKQGACCHAYRPEFDSLGPA